MSNLAAKISNEKGAVFVEFAIGFLLFLVLLFGLIDVGMMYHRRSEQEYAANQVVQLAAVVPGLEDSLQQNNDAYDVATDPALIALRERASKTLGTSSGFKLGETVTFSQTVTAEHLTTGTVTDENGFKVERTGIKGTRDGEIIADSDLYQQVSYPICKSSTSKADCDSASIGSMTIFLPVRTKTITNPDIKEALKEEPVISVLEFSSNASLNLIKFFHPNNARIRIFASAYRELSQDSNMPLAIGCDGKPLQNGVNPSKCPITTVIGMSCSYDASSHSYKVSDENCVCDTSLGFSLKPKNGVCVCPENSEWNSDTGRCECKLECDAAQGWYLNDASCRCEQEKCEGDGTVIRVGEDGDCSKCLCPEGYVEGSITETTSESGETSYTCNCQNCTGKQDMIIDESGSCVCKKKFYEEGSDGSDPDMCAENEVIVNVIVDDEIVGCKCVDCGENSHIKDGVCVCDDGFKSPNDDGMNCSACDDSRIGESCEVDEKDAVGLGVCRTNKGQLECVTDKNTNKSELKCIVNADTSKAETETCADTEDKNCDGLAGAPVFCCPHDYSISPKTKFQDPNTQCVALTGYAGGSDSEIKGRCPKGYKYIVRASSENTSKTNPSVMFPRTRMCGRRPEDCKKQALLCIDGVPTCQFLPVLDDEDNSCSVSGQEGVCAEGEFECKQVCDSNGENCAGVLNQDKCVQTNQEENEICDGLDNDCNGLVDDGIECDGKICTNDRYKDGKCVCDAEILSQICPASYNLEECSCGQLCNEDQIVKSDGTCAKCGTKTTGQVVIDDDGNKVCECKNDRFTLNTSGNTCSCSTKTEFAKVCYGKGQVLDIETCECMSGCPSGKREIKKSDGRHYCVKCNPDSTTADCRGSCNKELKVRCYTEKEFFDERICGCPGGWNCPPGISECSCPDDMMKLVAAVGGSNPTCECPKNSKKIKVDGELPRCECDAVEVRFRSGEITASQLAEIGGGCNCNSLDCNNANAPLSQQTPNTVDGVLVCNCGEPCGDKAVAEGTECVQCKEGGIATKTDKGYECACDPAVTDATYNEVTGCKCTREMAAQVKADCEARGGYFEEANCKCDLKCIPTPEGCGYKKEDGYCEDSAELQLGSCNANDIDKYHSDDYCYQEGEYQCINHEVVCVPVENGRKVKKECPQVNNKAACKKVPTCTNNDPWLSCDYADQAKATENCCGESPQDCTGDEFNPKCNWASRCDKTTGKYKACMVVSRKDNQCGNGLYLLANSTNNTCECRKCSNLKVANATQTDCVCPENAVETCKGRGQILNDKCKCVSCEDGFISRDGSTCECGLTANDCHSQGMRYDEENCKCESCERGTLNTGSNSCIIKLHD